jgi:hypothetical protein
VRQSLGLPPAGETGLPGAARMLLEHYLFLSPQEERPGLPGQVAILDLIFVIVTNDCRAACQSFPQVAG